jgi:hypothetical protein
MSPVTMKRGTYRTTTSAGIVDLLDAVEGVTHGFALFGPHLVLHAPGQQQEAAENGARLMTVTKMLNRVLIIASLLRSCYQHWVARHRQNQVGGLVERSLAALAVGPDDDANHDDHQQQVYRPRNVP